MHEITAFDSVGAKHACYQRELERLATECEDHLDLLAEGKEDSVRYVAARLGEAIGRVYAAGGARPSRRRASASEATPECVACRGVIAGLRQRLSLIQWWSSEK